MTIEERARLALKEVCDLLGVYPNTRTRDILTSHIREAVTSALESRTVPGRFYKCGCPVRVSSNWKAFCDEHCKVIREEEPQPEVPK